MTPTQYAANVAERFGHKHGCPGRGPRPDQLAARENRAMRAKFGISPMARDQWDKTGHSEETIAKIIASSHLRGEANVLLVIEALTGPMTQTDVMNKTGMPRSTVAKALERALNSERAFKHKLKRVTIWEPRREAAE